MASREFSSAHATARPPALVSMPRKKRSFSASAETAKLSIPCAPLLAYCSASDWPGVPGKTLVLEIAQLVGRVGPGHAGLGVEAAFRLALDLRDFDQRL